MSLQVKYIGLPVVWSIGLLHPFRHCQSCAVHVCHVSCAASCSSSAASMALKSASASASMLLLLLLFIIIVVVTIVINWYCCCRAMVMSGGDVWRWRAAVMCGGDESRWRRAAVMQSRGEWRDGWWTIHRVRVLWILLVIFGHCALALNVVLKDNRAKCRILLTDFGQCELELFCRKIYLI